MVGITLTYQDMVGNNQKIFLDTKKQNSVSGMIGGAAALGSTYAVAGAFMLNPKTAPIGIAIMAIPDPAIFAVGYKFGDSL